jgi:hypothetical protein
LNFDIGILKFYAGQDELNGKNDVTVQQVNTLNHRLHFCFFILAG